MSITTVTVIIPTHNRCASLRRLLDNLCAQTYPLEQMEVIVVSNGCTDGTLEMIRHYQAPFVLRVIEQSDQGPAAARNNGATQAKGRLLVFLDDDVEPIPGLIEAHVQAHQEQPGQNVVIGYLPPVFPKSTDFFRIELRRWWEDMFETMRQPGHRYTYRDLLSGNFSLEAELFAHIGGFNPAFRACLDDHEFGVRLIKANVSFIPARRAFGYHHEAKTLDGLLKRKHREGIAEVLMGRRHPDLKPTLLLTRLQQMSSSLPLFHLVFHLAFEYPAVGDILAMGLRRMLTLMEWARLRSPWRRFMDGLMIYWYLRGTAEELGSQEALANFLQKNPTLADEDEIEIDLSEGLEAAEQRLDNERPTRACIRYGQQIIGHIPPEPGAERLRGAHLRTILATDFVWPLLKSFTLDYATRIKLDIDTPDAFSSLPHPLFRTHLKTRKQQETTLTAYSNC